MQDLADLEESTARLRLSGISRRFGSTQALSNVSLHIHAAEIHALVGENGAGKSTLMKILSGADKPDSGTMHLQGAVYAPTGPADGRRAGVVMVYQELALAPHLTVAENIFLGAEPRRMGILDRRTRDARASAALARLGHPAIRSDLLVGDLSAAQQQIVEIARAVALGCRVLVLDEPTSSLGRADAERLFDLLRSLRADGLAIIYISHFLEEVRALSDRITVLRDGAVVASARTERMDDADIVAHMVGRPVADLYPRRSRKPGAPLLELKQVSGSVLPKSATLALHRGEVLGIAGLVGSGRTELLRCIFGLAPVRSGAITCGAFSGAATPAQRWNSGVGFVSEDRKREGLALDRSVEFNITLPGISRAASSMWLSPSALRMQSENFVRLLNLKCTSPIQEIASLSGGNQQKAALARLLHAGADILLLDEPTRGIDVGSKAEIYRIIDQLACGDLTSGREPAAILIVSSYLPELLGVCDRIAVMNRGSIAALHDARTTSEFTLMSDAMPAAENSPEVAA